VVGPSAQKPMQLPARLLARDYVRQASHKKSRARIIYFGGSSHSLVDLMPTHAIMRPNCAQPSAGQADAVDTPHGLSPRLAHP